MTTKLNHTQNAEKVGRIVAGLLDTHWTKIIDAKDESDEGGITVALSVKLGKDKNGQDSAECKISYGVKVKDAIGCVLDDPRQGKLEYVVKGE